MHADVRAAHRRESACIGGSLPSAVEASSLRVATETQRQDFLSVSVSPMKIPGRLEIRRGAPAWEARAATQGRPYNWPGTPTAIFIGSGEPQDHGNSVDQIG